MSCIPADVPKTRGFSPEDHAHRFDQLKDEVDVMRRDLDLARADAMDRRHQTDRRRYPRDTPDRRRPLTT